MFLKNTSGQGVYVFAKDVTTGLGKTGDAANITGNVSLDGGAVAGITDTNPTEIGGGWYWFDLTQAETNANLIAIYASSTTSNVAVDPVQITTTAGVIPVVAAGGNGGLPTVDASNRIAGIAGTVTTFDTLISGLDETADIVTAMESGSIASVSGSVASVTGAVGSVTGDVGGNVVGSVASVTGAVGSVTGNVGGNVVGTVASVVGAVGSVTGNVGGNVVGSVASVANAPTNWSSMVISAGGAVDALMQGVLNTLVTESSAGNIAGNLSTFYDNSDAATTKTVDDVGEGGGGSSTDLESIMGTALTETTAGRLAANLSTFLDNDDAATTKTVDDVGTAGTTVAIESPAHVFEIPAPGSASNTARAIRRKQLGEKLLCAVDFASRITGGNTITAASATSDIADLVESGTDEISGTRVLFWIDEAIGVAGQRGRITWTVTDSQSQKHSGDCLVDIVGT